jgi:membrane protein implicated in regulation of membrane protease activity
MSNFPRRAFGRPALRALYGLIAGCLFGWWGMSRGWPWWLAVPAAILVAVGLFLAIVVVLYGVARRVYEVRAASIRERVRTERANQRPLP